jgi:hypothetical protein
MGTTAPQIKVDIEANTVGANIIERRIDHSNGQGIHLYLTGAEVVTLGAG